MLSPVGARAVTAISDMKIWFARSCCPPQGRELLHDVLRFMDSMTNGLLSPAGARVVTAKAIGVIPATVECCCPPQGRELLQQKCEKYNADFRHSYNLFVLSSVFLRIHS